MAVTSAAHVLMLLSSLLLVSSTVRAGLVAAANITSSAVSAEVAHVSLAKAVSLVGSAVATVSLVVRVAQHFVFWLFRLMVDVLYNRVCVMVVLVVDGHIDEVLLMVTSTESSSTAQDGRYSQQKGADLPNKEGIIRYACLYKVMGWAYQ